MRRPRHRAGAHERIHYDGTASLTGTSSIRPAIAATSNIETDRTETPSPSNSLGVKGVGEAGTIAASAAVTNAVIDALRPLGVSYMDMPLSPMRIWDAISAAAPPSNGGPA